MTTAHGNRLARRPSVTVPGLLPIAKRGQHAERQKFFRRSLTTTGPLGVIILAHIYYLPQAVPPAAPHLP